MPCRCHARGSFYWEAKSLFSFELSWDPLPWMWRQAEEIGDIADGQERSAVFSSCFSPLRKSLACLRSWPYRSPHQCSLKQITAGSSLACPLSELLHDSVGLALQVLRYTSFVLCSLMEFKPGQQLHPELNATHFVSPQGVLILYEIPLRTGPLRKWHTLSFLAIWPLLSVDVEE